MIDKKTWIEFKDSGLLWWINTLLHTFGWSIVIILDDKGEITEAYPARVKFRGFNETSNTEGYQKVSQFMKENCDDLIKETLE